MKPLIFISLAFGLVFLACGNKNSESKNSAPTLLKNHSSIISREYNTSGGSLIRVEELQFPRAVHSATLLKDGNVLICGGFSKGSSNRLASAEIYDSTLKSFTSINDLNTPRVDHSATLLPNGKVLIAGGYNGHSLGSTELYDPVLKTFSPGPNMITARYGHTATILHNNKIFFTGGVGSGWTFLSLSEIYDIKKNKFIPAQAMSEARESHTATLLNDGMVLITGGHIGRRENLKLYSSSEIYNPKTNQFISTGPMNIPRHKHDAVLLRDGKVMINGGSNKNDSLYSSAEIYDPKTSQFTSIANMNYPRFKHKETSILLPDDNVLLGGGSHKAEVYNFKTGEFSPVQGNMGSTRLFSSATLLQTGEVLITGGYDTQIKAISESLLFVFNQE